MLLVCLSHYADLVYAQSPRTAYAMLMIGLPATPVFLALSGVVLGYLSVVRPLAIGRQRRWLLDRGLFLLLVAHVLLALPHLSAGTAQFHSMLWRSTQITDVIGICFVVVAFVIGRVAPARLIAGSIVLLICSMGVGIWLQDRVSPCPVVTRLLFGATLQSGGVGYVLPIAVYLPIFLIGLGSGQLGAGRMSSSEGQLQLARSAAWIGTAAVAVAFAVKLLAAFARPESSTEIGMAVFYLSDPRQKVPVGPMYLAYCGGVGLLLAAFFLWAVAAHRFARVTAAAATVGRASLAVFVIQAWIYFGFLPLIADQLSPAAFWIMLPASLAAIWAFARLWDRKRWNRWLTLGLR